MKFVRLFTVAALVSAFATASFAGSCCSKKKKEDCGPEDCGPDGKPKTEQTQEKK